MSEGRRAWVAAALLCAAWSIGAAAQRERITIRFVPAPNQVVHLRSTQDVSFDVAPPDADGAPTAASSGTFMVKIASVHTMTLGAPDGQGRVEAEVVNDQLSADVSLNGQPLQGLDALQALVGQRVKLLLDGEGHVTDVSTSAENANLMATSKELLTRIFGSTPVLSLTVGEAATVPLVLALPLPVAGNSLNATGETRYTLESVTREGSGRIAHLSLVTSSQVRQPLQGPAGQTVTIEMVMASVGTLDADLDRGLVRASQQHGTIDVTLHGLPSAIAPLPSMRFRGTIASSTQASN